jgi:acyl carrier protein
MPRLRYVLILMMTVFASAACAAEADVQTVVSEIVAGQLKLNQSAVGLDTPLSAVGKGADALDVIEIMMAIERTLHVDISDANVEAIVGPNKTEQLPAKTTVRKLTKMVAIARRT